MLSRTSPPTSATADELQLLSQLIIKKPTASGLREIILSLCTPGSRYKGLVEEITELVKDLENSIGHTNNRDGLLLHLFDFTNEELGYIILQISHKNDIARKRVNMIAEKIVAEKSSNHSLIEGQNTPQAKEAPIAK